ncbi:DUF2135 domain-containing protein [Lysobacter sp. KIS68-7]|uniref:VIT domain-containing protein n=1 Tax=Lysobacter sp. KIS68-7 TaxID=2904252 RepID=UPI001E2F15F0|nr:VIT domain-containing protein [Lysobacter sp. KIS68-7]UHQ18974.1 DUF2135 domain-containing protein [Lysobacter sp. KIS68-7]
MPRILVAAAVCALTLALAPSGFAQRQPNPKQHVTAPPLIRIGGEDTRSLQPIRLRQAQVDVDVAGHLARTTYTLVLHNPNARQLEGTLEFPLAAGQQVTGFALDFNGALREAVPVPKDKGRAVFESIERRRVDPALLERTAGNHFRLRIYPIPARGERRVRMIVDESLRSEGGDGVMELPMQLLAGADEVALNAHGPLSRRAPRTDGPLELRFPLAKGPAHYTAAFNGARYVLAETPLHASAPHARALPHSVGLLWDASASARTRDRDAEFALLDRYFKAMGEGRVTLRLLRDVGTDGGVFAIHGGDWSALRNVLARAVHDGATNLADWQPRAEIGEYLLVSDGMQDYGDARFPALSADQRLYAISTAGSDADATRLATLAQQRNGRLIAWQGRAGLDAATKALLQDGIRIVSLQGREATDIEVPSRFIDDGVLRIAARASGPNASVRVRLSDNGVMREMDVALPVDDTLHPQVAQLWAGWRVAVLSGDPERNRDRIAELGQRFGIVTAGTSLIVLDAAADYVRYGIAPPAELRGEADRIRTAQVSDQGHRRAAHLDAVASEFAQRVAWWETKYPKNTPVSVAKQGTREEAIAAADAAAAAADAATLDADAAEEREVAGTPAMRQMMMPPPPPAPAAAPVMERARGQVALLKVAAPDVASAQATIALQPWNPDTPYARRLRDAAPGELYARYLQIRDDNADSTAFYLDVADLLLRKGRRAEGLRVLSNLAEMQLEDRHVMRVLGYRLMQAKENARAVQVFRTVLSLAGEEPQSHRDLGLALAAAGQRQEAIEHLYEVVAREWEGRFAEVELVALNELNAIIARSPTPLDTSFIDKRLLRNLPVGLRAVLAWDSDNSDMDLWVTDPNGERCYYGNRNTYQGGLLSDDFTGGYGPEEFLLRDAKPGKYKVQAHYFGDRQQIVTGATTLTLMLSTGWGRAGQKDQSVTLRLAGGDEAVLVGEFEVR